MSDDRFIELLKTLQDPLSTRAWLRTAFLLREVVEACGQAGDDALERICKERLERHRRNAEDRPNRPLGSPGHPG